MQTDDDPTPGLANMRAIATLTAGWSLEASLRNVNAPFLFPIVNQADESQLASSEQVQVQFCRAVNVFHLQARLLAVSLKNLSRDYRRPAAALRLRVIKNDGTENSLNSGTR
jgi:hypothetical protein